MTARGGEVAFIEATTAINEAVARMRDLIAEENERGGSARGVVDQIAKVAGVDLGVDVIGERWNYANMMRAFDAVEELQRQRDEALSLLTAIVDLVERRAA